MTIAMTNNLLAIAIIPLVFCTMLSALSWLQHKYQPDAELVRKLFHLGMGVFALSFPLLLTALWQAWLLCGLTLGLLLALRRVEPLRQRFGAVLGNVQRCSHGELYFALGVTALFCLARHSLLLYSVPLLILTFADAAAALVGQRFGRHRYRSLACAKSLEGSAAFFTCAALSTAGLLVLVAALPVTHAVLIAVALALILTVVEALAWRGLDNLFLPLSAYWLLNQLLYRTTEELLALLLLAIWFVTPLLIIGRELNYDATHSHPRPNAA